MQTITDTERDILRRYADDAAFIADEDKPATDLATFARHLADAAEQVAELPIGGVEELETAATLLADSVDAAPDQRPVLLDRAAALLRIGGDALEEYRLGC